MGQSLQPGYKLIITNGDAAGELLRKTFTETEVLPWRDVLHDGPVPLTDTLEELSEIRADFLAERGWGDPDTLRENFRARDRGIGVHQTFDNVTLWFEHDLYDQLQLLQILDWFHASPGQGDGLKLVQPDTFLGTQSPESLTKIAKTVKPVLNDQLVLASSAWNAFRQPAPLAWAGLLNENLSALPYLEQAVRRMLQELPGARSGLARTQHQILLALNEGVDSPRLLFGAVERFEEAAFMGDWSFWAWLDGMADGPGALIEGLEQRFSPAMTEDDFRSYIASPLRMTQLGLQVLGGGTDYARSVRIDRWLGGSHITNEHLWRWDDQALELVAPS